MPVFIFDSHTEFSLSKMEKLAKGAIQQSVPVEQRYIGVILHLDGVYNAFEMGFSSLEHSEIFMKDVYTLEPRKRNHKGSDYLYFSSVSDDLYLFTRKIIGTLSHHEDFQTASDGRLHMLANLSDWLEDLKESPT